MNKLLSRAIVIVSCAALPLAALAGVAGTHGPDRSSGAVVAKPKPPAAEPDQGAAQTAKPEEKKEQDAGKEAK